MGVLGDAKMGFYFCRKKGKGPHTITGGRYAYPCHGDPQPSGIVPVVEDEKNESGKIRFRLKTKVAESIKIVISVGLQWFLCPPHPTCISIGRAIVPQYIPVTGYG